MKKTLFLPFLMVCMSLAFYLPGQAQVSLPFVEDFEGGGPDTTLTASTPVINGLVGTGYAWSYQKTLEGRLRMQAWQDWGLTTPFTTSGIHAITLDDTVGNATESVNDLILTINMSSYTGNQVIELDFNFSHHGEEPDVNDRVFVRGSVTDTWVTLYNLNTNQPTAGTWKQVKGLDLDSALSANNQSLSATTQIRFGQQDDFGADDPTFSDGYTFDDIMIYELSDVSAAAVAITSPVSGCGLGADTVCITYSNVGAMAFDSAQVFYSINGSAAVSELDTTSLNPGDQTTYCFTALGSFSAVGNYTIQVWVQAPGDTLPADDTTTIVITNIPIISSFPYFENFESGSNGWIAGGTNSSWALATPANPTISGAASGTNAWITNPSGNYNANENSFVQSPCMDFSTIFNPRICLGVWWNAEFSWDGAALQSSINGGQSWQLVGTLNGVIGDPINWYTDNSVNGNPGGQQIGWSGRGSSGNGSNGYVLAQHDLINLGGQSQVLLRVAFGADGSVQDDGFAFDDVLVFEKPAIDASALSILSPLSGCGLTTDTVRFAYYNSGSNAFDSAVVSYQVNGGTVVSEIDVTNLLTGDTSIFTFATLANVSAPTSTVRVWVTAPNDQLPFKDSLQITINNIPVISSFPYLEDFESGPGGWTAGGGASSWQLGLPRATVIDTAASGQKAWMTDTATFYNINENSFVESPCFDLSLMVLPVVAMNIWWDSDIFDGANLQYSLDEGASWFNVGAFGGPNNWYNQNNLFGFPGGSLEGWGGSPGSGGWVRAEQQISALAAEPSVRFRINFGEDGFGNTVNGFAFDDFELFEQPPTDGQIIAVTDPVSNCSIGMDTVCISYFNNGTVPFDSAFVSYRINGGTIVTERDTTTLQPGDTATFCFAALGNFTAVGTYQVDAWLSIPGDIQGANDSTTAMVDNVVSISSFPYDQDFENGPAGWTSGGVANSWELGRPVGIAINSAASGLYAWVTDTAGNYNNNENSFVISPCFDFSSLILPIVDVNIWWNSETSWDGTVLQSSTDGGNSWTNVGRVGDPNWFNDTTINGNPGGQQTGWTNQIGSVSSGGWVRGTQVVSALAGEPRVRFRFAFGSDGSVNTFDGFAFDDFSVRESPAFDAQTLDALSPLSGCGLGTEQIAFRYINAGVVAFDSAEVSYSVNGATPVTEFDPRTINTGDTVAYPFTALYNFSAAGVYQIEIIIKVDGDSVNLNDTLRFSVSSVPNISTFPHLEDFESGPGGWTAGGNGNWQWGLPQGNTIDTAASGVKAWMTDTTANYNNSECSFVLSPCFDFSSLSLPIFRANIWVNSENSWDGTILQATTDSGLTWLTIGAFGDPNNWYNDGTITGLTSCLSGSGDGWTGATMGGYVPAEHELAFLAGEPDVRFRFFFGSDASVNGFDGFAFDDFEIDNLPPNDIGVVQILSPKSGQCGDSSTVVSVVIRNYGSSDQLSFPIRLDADTGSTAYASLNLTYSDTLNPGELDTVILGTINTFAGGNFTFTAYSLLANDTDRSNDTTIAAGISIQVIPDAPISADTTICAPDIVTLSVQIDTNFSYRWYDDATGGNVLADSTHLTASITRDTTFYVEAQSGSGGPCIRISEADLGAPDMIEIQNLSSQAFNATGYVVAVSNSYSDIDIVNTNLWNLGTMNGGQVMFRDDNPASSQYWGSNLFFNPGAFPGFAGWAMIIDNNGVVIDAVFWGWQASDIASISTTINGFTISGADIPWSGNGVDASNLAGSHIELTGSSESNDATDWDGTQSASSPGSQNGNLSIPYSCGGGCPSLRTAVRVLIRPFQVDLGPDRAVCEGTTLDGTTVGGASYLWSTSATTAAINVSQTGQYVLEVTSIDGCVGTDTLNLLVQPLPLVDLGPDTLACGSILLDAGNPGSQYSWNPGGNLSQTLLAVNPGLYIVNVTNQAGCTVADSVQVSLLPTPIVDLGPDQTACDESVLDAGSLPAGFSVLWSTNETTQTITVNQTGQYSVTVTDTAGCEGTDDIIVSILPGPNVDLGPDRTECDSVILDAGNFNSFTWSTNAMSRRITIKTAGTYYVDVLDNNGCTGSDTVIVALDESPNADWSAIWTSATDVQFTNASTPSGPGVTYLWDFGDGNSSTMENPTHTYGIAGNYIVGLTVSTPNCGNDDADKLIGTDLEDENFGRSITLFPNPSNGVFVMGISGLQGAALQITVSDVTGKTLMKFHEDQRIYGNFEQVIDLTGYAEGVYMVTVFDGQRYARKKMIVR